jgi:hypothetical protein
VNSKKTTIRQLRNLNIAALIWGLLILVLSVRKNWLAWNNDSSTRLALTCLLGPALFLITSFWVIFILVLVILNFDFSRKNRIGAARKQLIQHWLPLILALTSVCSIPFAKVLIDRYFQARPPSNSFIVRIEKDFDLSSVLPEYNKVIDAIEEYYENWGHYPARLADLVPDYLPEVPGIYIRNGERLTYKPEPMYESTPSFTFSIYGHYPGLAFMHGWTLFYCPVSYEGCTAGGSSYRINDLWLWIHSSAL